MSTEVGCDESGTQEFPCPYCMSQIVKVLRLTDIFHIGNCPLHGGVDEPCRERTNPESGIRKIDCICGTDSDPTGKLPRLDIVCPKHDGDFTVPSR